MRNATAEKMLRLVAAKGGRCLSDNPLDGSLKLTFECKRGHRWEAFPRKILEGSWCRACSVSKSRHSLEEVQKMAEEKGGYCLSTEYRDAHQKLKWQCKYGHEWEANTNCIQQGHWCPICSQGVSERICRKFFEEFFGKKFPKARPEWLLSPKGNKMELDGYCKDLGLAFEYQGRQHYRDKSMFVDETVIKHDELKEEICRKNGVILITVPYTVSYEEMPDYIVQECKKYRVPLPQKNIHEIDYKKFDIYPEDELVKLKQIAEARGGKCLSPKYIADAVKLEWQCKDGHTWKTAPTNIKQGRWCPVCSHRLPLTIEEMRSLAKRRGGKCLSDTYVDSGTKVEWQCRLGHVWKAAPDNVKNQQSWCPICTGRETKTIEEMQKLAQNRGGKCLSNKYVNSSTHLEWECQEGHQWKARPNTIQQGHWCPKCADALHPPTCGKRRTLEEMQKMAAERGGKCLSEKYVNTATKLKWECKKGHVWEATPNNVKSRHWCPKCKAEKMRRHSF